MLRSAFPDRGCQLCLNAVPTVAVANLGLVENLEEHPVRIELRIMLRKGTPVVGELLDERIVLSEFRLELTLRMNIDHHGETTIQNHLYRIVKVPKIFGGDLVGLIVSEH